MWGWESQEGKQEISWMEKGFMTGKEQTRLTGWVSLPGSPPGQIIIIFRNYKSAYKIFSCIFLHATHGAETVCQKGGLGRGHGWGKPDCANIGNDIQFSIKNYRLMKFCNNAGRRVFCAFKMFFFFFGILYFLFGGAEKVDLLEKRKVNCQSSNE